MLAAERLQKIVELVGKEGSIRNSELSLLFQVTEETIRRDLYKLEQEGKLLRSHGGAVSIKELHMETPIDIREITNVKEKQLIAVEAVKHIKQMDRIVLDASTTAWYMAKMMPDIEMTVLTNSIKVAIELSAKEKVQVISTGGMLSRKSLSYVGPLAERSLDSYHVDKAFISSKGAHMERGISEANELQALIKKKMISIADRTYLLCDYSKFGVQHFTQIADWSQIHHVVTNGKAKREYIESLKRMAVEVTLVDE